VPWWSAPPRRPTCRRWPRWRESFAAILEPEALASRDARFFAAQFAKSWPRMRVATRGARVVGFTLASGAHLDMLFVDPACTGSGRGGRIRSQRGAIRRNE
jgi:putative acetyltransferase